MHSFPTLLKKPLPPFGSHVQGKIRQGIKPTNDIFLFVGTNAFALAEKFSSSQWVLTFSANHSPYEYDWPVQNCSVLVFDRGGVKHSTIEQLAHALLMAGAAIVRIVLVNYRLVIYRRN